MKLVITWIAILFLALSAVVLAEETEGPDRVKFKNGGAVSAVYKHYEGGKVTIYLTDPRDGILKVNRSFVDEPPPEPEKVQVKKKPVPKINGKVKKRWKWKRR